MPHLRLPYSAQCRALKINVHTSPRGARTHSHTCTHTCDLLILANAVAARHGLQVVLGVPADEVGGCMCVCCEVCARVFVLARMPFWGFSAVRRTVGRGGHTSTDRWIATHTHTHTHTHTRARPPAPVAVVDDGGVCGREGDALAARARGQQEHKARLVGACSAPCLCVCLTVCVCVCVCVCVRQRD